MIEIGDKVKIISSLLDPYFNITNVFEVGDIDVYNDGSGWVHIKNESEEGIVHQSRLSKIIK